MLAETANFLGSGFGYLLSSLLVSSANDIPKSLWIYALISSCAMLLYFIVGRTEPNKIIVKLDLREGMGQMIRDKRLITILVVGSMGIAIPWTLLGVM